MNKQYYQAINHFFSDANIQREHHISIQVQTPRAS